MLHSLFNTFPPHMILLKLVWYGVETAKISTIPPPVSVSKYFGNQRRKTPIPFTLGDTIHSLSSLMLWYKEMPLFKSPYVFMYLCEWTMMGRVSGFSVKQCLLNTLYINDNVLKSIWFKKERRNFMTLILLKVIKCYWEKTDVQDKMK